MALPPKLRITQGSVLFVFGLAGFMHELVIADAERPTLLLMCAAMMGLPAFLGSNGGPKSGGTA